MECKVKNEYGTIYIAEDVMLKVVGYAALECYGIVAMSGQRATDGIVEWLGRENLTKGVQIRNVGDMLDVDLYIIVNMGFPFRKYVKQSWKQYVTSWKAPPVLKSEKSVSLLKGSEFKDR